jgi:hypothetical protein
VLGNPSGAANPDTLDIRSVLLFWVVSGLADFLGSKAALFGSGLA